MTKKIEQENENGTQSKAFIIGRSKNLNHYSSVTVQRMHKASN